MKNVVLSLALLAGVAVALKIDVTLPVECDRKTKAGDKIDVHYKGTLQKDGSKFDASSSLISWPRSAGG
jgi:FK506-binding protein 2